MNQRTGEEIRNIFRRSGFAWTLGDITVQQYLWTTTFWTLPPSAESLRETRAVA
jgi:hypothetical protein